MLANIPEEGLPRVVIAGAGFAGLKLARSLGKKNFQVVLLDRNNYHSFQPLLYQVATSGIEPSAISFPLRKVFQRYRNVHVRMAEVHKVRPDQNEVETSIGMLRYDYFVIAVGCDNNFFGNASIPRHAWPMKSVSESLALRNHLLRNFETALSTSNPGEIKRLLNFVVVGGGPTGVEISGALAEMRRYILPKDYPELNFHGMDIHLVEGSTRLMNGLSVKSSENALKYLEKMGVSVLLNTQVKNYDGVTATLSSDKNIETHTLIWAAGIKGNLIGGLDEGVYGKGSRIKVDRFNRVEGYDNIYALGDIAFMTEDRYPHGHPQVAQAAIQQAKCLSDNLTRMSKNREPKPFTYKDLGSLATVGRNRAVVDLPFISFQGILAWYFWMFVHLMSIVGIKNRLLIFINWAYSYFTYDQSLRLILKPQKHGN